MTNTYRLKPALWLHLCGCMLLISISGYSQTAEIGAFSINGYDDRSYDITTNTTGTQIYLAGSADLGTGSAFIGNNFNLLGDLQSAPLQILQPPLEGNGEIDGYLARLDNNGNLIWMLNFGGAGQDEALAVEVGMDGNIYVAGYYFGQAVFSGFNNNGSVTLTSESGSNMDIYLACYSPSGDLIWARDAGGASDDAAYDIEALQDGIVIAGLVNDGSAKFGSIDILSDPDDDEYGCFVAKYSYTGSVQWINTSLSNDMDEIQPGDYINFTGENFQQKRRIQIAEHDDIIYVSSMLKGSEIWYFHSIGNTLGSGSMNGSNNRGLNIKKINSSGVILNNVDINSTQFENEFAGLSLSVDCENIYMALAMETDFASPVYHANAPSDISGDDPGIVAVTIDINTLALKQMNIMVSEGPIEQNYPTCLTTDKLGNVYMQGIQRNGICSSTLGCNPATSPTNHAVFYSTYNTDLQNTNYWNFDGNGTDIPGGIHFSNNHLYTTGRTTSTNVSFLSSLLTLSNNSNSYFLIYEAPAVTGSICCNLPQGGLVASATPTVCKGEQATLTLSSYNGSIQWFYSTDNGINFLSVAASNANVITALIEENTMFRATLTTACGSENSNTFEVEVDTYSPVNTNLSLTAGNNCFALCPDLLTPYITTGCTSYTQSPLPGTELGLGIHTVSILSSASVLIDTYTITVIDNSNPVIFCPANKNLTLNTSCSVLIPDFKSQVVISDNCMATTLLEIEQTPAPNTLITAPSTQQVYFTVTDEAGNFSTCIINVHVLDTIAPVVVCPANQFIPNGVNCIATIPDYRPLVNAADNCSPSGALVVTQTPAPGTTVTSPTTIQMQVTDASGLSTLCSFLAIPVDQTPPVITCPGNQSLIYNSSCLAVMPDYRSMCVVNDNCNSAAQISLTQFPAPGINVGSNTLVVITATDLAGNKSTCNFIVTPVDQFGPPLSCPANITVPTNPNTCDATVTYPITVMDNCSAVLESIVGFSLIGTFNGHTYFASNTSKTWMAAYNDAMALGGHLVTIESAAENQFLPTNQMYWIGLTDQFTEGNYVWVTGEPVVYTNWNSGEPNNQGNEDFVHTNYLNAYNWNDEDSGMTMRYIIEFDKQSTDPTLVLTSGFPSGSSFPLGTTMVSYQAQDGNGNSTYCSFDVTVVDQTPPIISCPGDQTISVNASCQKNLPDYTTSVSVSDNCTSGTIIAIEQSPLPGEVGANTLVTISATDEAGNTSTCTFLVTFIDDIAPAIICPGDQTVYIDTNCEKNIVDYRSMVTVSDNCTTGDQIILEQTPQPGLVTGNTVVTIKATDTAGNYSECSFNVNFVDTIKPVIVCPGDQTINADDQCMVVIPDFRTQAIASDNCTPDANLIVEQIPAPLTGITGSTTTVITLTVRDQNNNVDSCSFNLLIDDITPPVIICPEDVEVEMTSATGSIFVNVEIPLTNDNCGPVVVTNSWNNSGNASDSYPVGNTEITWTATDGGNLQTTCVSNVNVTATIPPAVDCLSNITGYTSADECTSQLQIDIPAVNSPTGTYTLTNSFNGTENSSGEYPVGTTEVIWTVTDANGLSATCITTVEVLDTIAPVIVCPAPLLVTLANDVTEEFITVESPTVFENCGGYVLSNNLNLTDNASGIFGAGVYTIQWIATDQHGQSAVCSSSVEIVQEILPEIDCAPTLTFYSSSELCGADLQLITPQVTSGGAITSMTNSVNNTADASGFYAVGQHEIIWTAIDDFNNQSTCTTEIFVLDTIKPVIECPVQQTYMLEPNMSEGFLEIDTPAVDDNCAIFGITNSIDGDSDASGIYSPGSYTITWTAVDVNGNMNTCNTTFIVLNNDPPQIDCLEELTVYSTETSCSVMVEIPVPVVTDDNGVVDFYNTQNNTGDASGIYEPGLYEIIWTATDTENNIGHCVTSLAVIDTIRPTVICQSEFTVTALAGECTAFVNVTPPNYTDNCQISSITNSYNETFDASDYYDLGDTTIYWIVSDIFGNTSFCDVEIHVVALQPTIECPTAQAVIPDDSNNYSLPDYTVLLTEQYGCAGSTEFIQTPLPGTIHSGVITVTVQSADETISCSFDVIPSINSIPVIINCPQDQTVYTDENCMIVIPDLSTLLSESDIESTLPYTIHQSPEAGMAVAGIEEISLWIEDINTMMSNVCSIQLNTTDTISPDFIDPLESYTLGLSENCETIIPSFDELFLFTDNCSSVSVMSQSPLVGTAVNPNPEGISCEITISDESGNTATHQFQIQFEDDASPVVNYITSDIIFLNSDCEAIAPDYENLITASIEDCSEYTLQMEGITTQQIFNTPGIYPVTITVTDIYSNQTIWNISLTVADNTAPVAENIEVNLTLESDQCALIFNPSDYISLASQGCNETINATILTSLQEAYSAGTYVISYQLSDGFNLSEVAQINLTVADETAPTFTSVNPNNFIQTCDPDFIIPTPVAEDCGENIIPVMLSSATLQPGLNTIQFSAVDQFGNESFYSYTIELTATPEYTLNQVPQSFCEDADPFTIEINTTSDYTILLDGAIMNNDVIDIVATGVGSHTLEIIVGAQTACPVTENIEFDILSNPVITAGQNSYVTCGDELQININTSEGNITWTSDDVINFDDTSNANPIITAAQEGQYTVEVEVQNGQCSASLQIGVEFITPPTTIDAGPEQELYLTTSTRLNGSADEGFVTTWSSSNPVVSFEAVDELNTIVNGLTNGINEIILTSANDACAVSDTLIILVNGLVIPTGFSPNGDGDNDTFEIKGLENTGTSNLNVFNRWGQLVYESADYKNDWAGENNKGELLPDDTYFMEIAIAGEVFRNYVVVKRN